MKKLFTLIALTGFAFGANAQRHIDLSVTLNSPNSSTAIDGKNPFYLDAVITNNGTDAITPADTFGGLVLFKNSVVLQYPFAGRTLNTGDTVQIKDSLTYTYTSPADSNASFCIVGVVQNRTNPTTDGDTTNNVACATILVKAHSGVGVPSLTSASQSNTVTIYPNPIQSDANFTIGVKHAGNVTIRIMDVIGRVVVNENEGRLDVGQHAIRINTGNLQNGMYIYQVMIGDEAKTGKIYISK